MIGRPGLDDRPVAVAGSRRNLSDLMPRALSAIIMIALALWTSVVGAPWFNLLWLAAAIAIHWEWQALIGGGRQHVRFVLGGAAIVAAGQLAGAAMIASAALVVAIGAIVLAIVVEPGRRWMAGAGIVYAAALLISLVLLRTSFPYGLQAVLWLFAVVWTTDVMAYFGGRLIGGRKLWPRVSPSKTWAGFLVGVSSGGLAGLLATPAPKSSAISLVLGIVAGAIAQGGDLFESGLKRHYGAKDSSHLIPGHGGVMDRLDGFVAAATFAACLGVARFGVEAPGSGLFRW